MYSRNGNLRSWRGEMPLSPTEKEERELKARAKLFNSNRQPEVTYDDAFWLKDQTTR